MSLSKQAPSAAAMEPISDEERTLEVLSLGRCHRKFVENMTRYDTFVGSLISAMNIYNHGINNRILTVADIPNKKIDQKRKQCRDIIKVLDLMGAPRGFSPRHIIEYDFSLIFPTVEWIVTENILSRANDEEIRQSFRDYFLKKFESEELALEAYEAEMAKIIEDEYAQRCSFRMFQDEIFGKGLPAEELLLRYCWNMLTHNEAHEPEEKCHGIIPPPKDERPCVHTFFGEDKAHKDLCAYRSFIIDVIKKINIESDLAYIDEALKGQVRAHHLTKNDIEYLKIDIATLEAEERVFDGSWLTKALIEVKEQLNSVKAFKKMIRQHKDITNRILVAWRSEYIENRHDMKSDKLAMQTTLMDHIEKYDETVYFCKAHIRSLKKMVLKIQAMDTKNSKKANTFNGSDDLAKKKSIDNSHVDMIVRVTNIITRTMEVSQNNVPKVDSDKSLLYYESFFAYIDDITTILCDIYWKAVVMRKMREDTIKEYHTLQNTMREKQRQHLKYDELVNKLFLANNTNQHARMMIELETLEVIELRKEIEEMLPKVDTRNVARSTLLDELLAIELV